MRFGSVSGNIGGGAVDGWFTVVLHTGSESVVVRDDVIPPHFRDEDPAWLIDQLVQETIGNELAESGWEVIAVSEGEPTSASSRTWTVRNLG